MGINFLLKVMKIQS